MTNKQKQLDLDSEVHTDILDRVRDFIKEQHLTPSQANAIFNERVLEIVEKSASLASDIPVSIFKNSRLSALESIVKYMKEDLGLRFNDISSMLSRSSRTIWTTYSNARKKMPERFGAAAGASDVMIPLQIFRDRSLGVQEAIVKYLRETIGLNYHKIAVLLNRDDRTIWTAYDRIAKKQKSKRKLA